MTSYERYCEIRDNKGLKDAHVAETAGIGKSTFSDWKNGRSVPKREKMEKIAKALGISIEYLLTGETTDGFMYDNETLEMAQRLYQNPKLHLLFDAAEDVSPESLEVVSQILMVMKKTERGEE